MSTSNIASITGPLRVVISAFMIQENDLQSATRIDTSIFIFFYIFSTLR